tara:strand:+ start:326 stop:457 length:132 start_codon:yes stop_codon:yes gene_type:complete
MNKYFLKSKSTGKKIQLGQDQDQSFSGLQKYPWYECTKPRIIK